MRRSIWTPVAVTMLVWAAASIVPQLGLGAKHAPGLPAVSWLAPPSWPVPALRAPRAAWAAFEHALSSPAWPAWPAWRAQLPRSIAINAIAWRPTPAAGAACAAALALVALFFLLARLPLGRGRFAAHTVRALAGRGVAHGHIARRVRLSRDSVRSLIDSAGELRARRRA